jgi:tripartite motif-containing protein 71
MPAHRHRSAAPLAFAGATLFALLPLTAGAQPFPRVSDPAAPEGLRCPGPDLSSFDPTTEQIAFQWQNVVTYQRTFDDQGPRGLALDRACNLYVADSANQRIVKLSPEGGTLAQWGTPGRGAGQLTHPDGVAVDAAGNVYVADTGNDRVQKLSPSGQSLATWGKCLPGVSPCSPTPGANPGEFAAPEAVAVDGAGNVYVSDSMNDRVQKLGPDGKALAQFGSHGSGPGQLDSPFGLAVDRLGNVYVADLNNNRIQEFSPDGKAVAQFGSHGSGPGQLTQPRGVAVDANGNVYAADTQQHRVQEFTPDGSFLAQWRRCEDGPDVCHFPNSGSAPGEFFHPRGLIADGQGQVYVADTANNRVERMMLTLVPLPAAQQGLPSPPDDSGGDEG